ncbi:hypothetical protein PG5_21590 [Pseudomonas sp. G5(2012)]|nr:hypothetical protein PG5_21590 [Pseudomonas sp. G5(2012)]
MLNFDPTIYKNFSCSLHSVSARVLPESQLSLFKELHHV